VTAPIAAVRSISACRPLVERADVVVGMGAYVSVPVGLAAARARRPLVIHEQDAVPGLANRLLARWAHTVTLAFEDSAARLPGRVRTVLTGDPVRDEILTVVADREALADRAFIEFGLEPGRRTLRWRSQGALRLNTAALELIARLRDRATSVLLLTGGAGNWWRIGSRPVTCGSVSTSIAWTGVATSWSHAQGVAELSVCGFRGARPMPRPAAIRRQRASARAEASVLADAD
jgi:hypothetical protein